METESYGASDVIGEDTVLTASLLGMFKVLLLPAQIQEKKPIFLLVSIMAMLDAFLRYSDIPTREIQRICPACRGTCNCKVCMRGDNLVKVL